MIRRATVVSVGKPKGWPAEACQDYLKRLRRHFPVEVVEVAEEDMNRRSRDEVLLAEEARILKRIPAESYVISLDRQEGKQHPSEELAARLEDLGIAGRSHVTFVIGGPLGLSEGVRRTSHELWSFGPVTLPHALARVVLLEQLFRAVKIQRGEKYHW